MKANLIRKTWKNWNYLNEYCVLISNTDSGLSSRITIKDLAEQLKVSTSTVSRALQDHPDISTKTKKMVWDLADQLNYHPNIIAASLRKNKTFTLGVIVPEIVHYFFSSIISGIEDVAYSEGYKVIICQSSENYQREVINLEALITGRVDGVLMSISKQTDSFEHVKETLARGIPLIFFDRICEKLKTSRVVVDDYQGAFEATSHLIGQGCKRIAHLAGPDSLLICRERKRGFIDALKKHNFSFDESLSVLAQNREDGQKATRELMNSNNPPDAFFTNNDYTAAGSLLMLKSMGFKIPSDVAVVGFTDDPGICTIVDPTLSSVHQPAYEMGSESARILLNLLKSGIDTFDNIILKTHLVVRQSSKRKNS